MSNFYYNNRPSNTFYLTPQKVLSTFKETIFFYIILYILLSTENANIMYYFLCIQTQITKKPSS